MFENVKNYFNFNRGERIGIIVVIIIVIIVTVYPFFLKGTIQDNTKEFLSFISDIEKFEKSQKKA